MQHHENTHMKTVFVTGGTGFIGDALIPMLHRDNWSITCLTRNPDRARTQHHPVPVRYISTLDGLRESPDAIINLAGLPIVEKRWSEERKRALHASRIGLTEKLIAQLKEIDAHPSCVISGSAISYYGPHSKNTLDENDIAGTDFSAKLCRDWERAATPLSEDGACLYLLRIGLVLGLPGGFLGRIKTPFSFGLGGVLGSGDQMMSWIHRQDLAEMICWLLAERPGSGAYNATAPTPISNYQFTKALGEVMHRPTVIRLPRWLISTLMGESSTLLLDGQSVLPNRALKAGFTFAYPDIWRALREILQRD